MADDSKNDGSLFDDDAMIEDLDMNDVAGLEGAQAEGGQPLPKKVELDIDDMYFDDEEEEEEEAEAVAAPEPPTEKPKEEAEAPAEEEEKQPRRFSIFKLALLAVAALVPLIILFVGGAWYFTKDEPPPDDGAAVERPKDLDMQPFIVHYPDSSEDEIMVIGLVISFPDVNVQNEFASRNTIFRDVIYRYLQGRGPFPPGDDEVKKELSESLAQLINKYLRQGRIKSVTIQQPETV